LSQKKLDKDFPVDIVYAWVDDQDPQWKEKKKSILKDIEVNIEANDICRFINNNELLYSIRSIYKYCSWFNKIYIVTDDQIPNWLQRNTNDIIIVDHKTIFGDAGTLPTFNSNVIESRIHHIPNLCEHYIYFNDDFFIGRKLSKSFFFSENGNSRIYMTKKKSKRKVLNVMKPQRMLKQKLYPRNLNLARMLVLEKCNKLILNYPIHNPKGFCKSDIFEVETYFHNIILKTLRHQFRKNEGIYFLALCMFFLIANGNKPLVMKPYRSNRITYNFSYFRKNRDFVYLKLGIDPLFEEKYRLINKYKPAFFCINDTNLSTDLDRKKMVDFLINYFPDKSNAEK